MSFPGEDNPVSKKNVHSSVLQSSSNSIEVQERVERVKIAIAKGGGNKVVCQRSGIPLSSLNSYIAGRSMKAETAALLANTCSVSLEWLIQGTESQLPASTQPIVPQAEQDVVEMPYVSTEASAGFGLIPGQAEEVEYIPVSRRFLYKFLGFVPKTIFMIRVVGDSMTPTIKPYDRLIVDTAPRHITHGIYILAIDEAIYVKRLGLKDINNFTVISDNPSYPTFDVPMSEVCWGNATPTSRMRIIGRVVVNCQMLVPLEALN